MIRLRRWQKHFSSPPFALRGKHKGGRGMKKLPVIYYGTFREKRVKYFKKYFDEQMVVSTSPKKIQKLGKQGGHYLYLPMVWVKNLGLDKNPEVDILYDDKELVVVPRGQEVGTK